MNAELERAVAERGPSGEVRPNWQSGGAQCVRQRKLTFKFGGTSVAGADRMLAAAKLVREAAAQAQVTVVVSAMRGVTDRLLEIARALASDRLALARTEAEFVLHLHREVLRELHVDEESSRHTRRELDLLGRDLLHEVPVQARQLPPAETPQLFDRLASFGERCSARLFAAALAKAGVPAIPVTSSDFVVTCDQFQNAKPDLVRTRQIGRDILFPLLDAGVVPVVTGFLGAAPDGRITTLGRNSSDYSGAIVAHVVDADELVIWTDVDGIYAANPNVKKDARLLHDLTYEQAYALAAGGARVLHPGVLPLAAETQMVVWVRNTFKPHLRGTRIGPSEPLASAGGAA